MANNVHIKIDGIEGESADAKHSKTIDVLAWSWGMSQSGTFHIGSGGGQGKANVQDLSFTKVVDSASTKLQHACVVGDHIAKAVLTVTKAGAKHRWIFSSLPSNRYWSRRSPSAARAARITSRKMSR